MKKCVIYARYSSERQTEQSIEGQLRVCYEFAKNNELIVVHEYIDRAMTGTNDLRKEFQQMLSDSEKTNEWDICLVYALDRFGRNSIEQAINKFKLQKTGKIVISATQRTSRNIDGSQNLDGIILENMYVGMAEYFSAELSQKVKRGLNESRIKGQFTGGVPIFGYEAYGTKAEGRKVRIKEDEAVIVRRIFDEYASGRLIKDIHDDLNNEGVLCHGKPFTRTAFYNLLKNEKYIGIVRFGNQIFDNIYPPIVKKQVFDICRAKAQANKIGKHTDVQYLLKNKVHCGYCGRSVSSDTGTSKNGTVMRYYKCIGRKVDKNCDNVPIRKELLEQLVIDSTYQALSTPDLIEKIADLILSAHEKRMADNSIINILESQLQDISTSITNLIACMEKGIVSSSTAKRLEELENQKIALETKISLEKVKESTLIQKRDIVNYLKNAIKKTPRLMIELIIKDVILYKDRIEIHFNYTDLIRPDAEPRQAFLFFKFTKEIIFDYHWMNWKPIKKNIEINLLI